jgi:hypothetical protein
MYEMGQCDFFLFFIIYNLAFRGWCVLDGAATI